MDNLPMDALLTQIWQMVSPYVGGAWAALQRIFAETPTPLLIGIVVGLLLARVLLFKILLTIGGNTSWPIGLLTNLNQIGENHVSLMLR